MIKSLTFMHYLTLYARVACRQCRLEVACQKITTNLLELMHSLLSRHGSQRGSNTSTSNTIQPPHPSPPSSANSSSCYNNGYACSISCFDPWCQGCYSSAHCACNGKAQMHKRERERRPTLCLTNCVLLLSRFVCPADVVAQLWLCTCAHTPQRKHALVPL